MMIISCRCELYLKKSVKMLADKKKGINFVSEYSLMLFFKPKNILK
jgi:hypothetical protein